ncbi:MAG: ribose-phosphate pyrophosphokinase [Ignavibacteria bacterium]|nr:ribose-phosphate pyrophosphokinase [Ignavibacteria bacterium]
MSNLVRDFKVFTGNSNKPLAEAIGRELKQALGKDLGHCEIKKFSDGEIWVKYADNIRGSDVFIIQSTNTPHENLMELLIMIDAARRASANKITAVIPYFGYSRQDRKDQPRVSITAKLVANLITVAGADRVITMDLHASQVQGFFDIPFDHLYASATFFKRIEKLNLNNLAVVSPDVGGIKLARAYAKRFNADLVVIDKRRPQQNVTEIMNIIGNVEGKNVLLVDDIIDTANTFTQAAHLLKEKGALSIIGICTHPVFSSDSAVELLNNAPLDKLFVTDTINNERVNKVKNLEVVSVAKTFALAIQYTFEYKSISSLFDTDKD